MPPTIRLRSGDISSVQYQLADFDETTSGLIPLDLTSVDAITCENYWQKFGEYGTVESILLETASCNILDADTGWINTELTFPTIGMYKIKFVVTEGTSIKRYPRYDDQYIHAME